MLFRSRTLAVEAGRTLLIDRSAVLAAADEAGLAIWGIGATDEAEA